MGTVTRVTPTGAATPAAHMHGKASGRPAGHDNNNAVRRGHFRDQAEVVCGVQPAGQIGSIHAFTAVRSGQEFVQRPPDVLVQIAFDVLFAHAVRGHAVGVFRTQHDNIVAGQIGLIAPADSHAGPEGIQNAARCAAAVIAHTLRSVAAIDADGALLRLVAVLDVEGVPRVLFFVLADAIGVFAGMAHGRFIDLARMRPADINHNQAQTPGRWSHWPASPNQTRRPHS